MTTDEEREKYYKFRDKLFRWSILILGFSTGFLIAIMSFVCMKLFVANKMFTSFLFFILTVLIILSITGILNWILYLKIENKRRMDTYYNAK